MRAFVTRYSLLCRDKLLSARVRVRRFLETYNELHLAALLFILWLPASYVLWWFFPDAAPMSGGQLQKLYLTALVFAFGHGFLWIGLKLNLPVVQRWVEQEFTTVFTGLTPWQKALFFLGIWVSYLLSFSLIWQGASQVV